MLSGLLKSRVAGKKRSRGKNFSSLCGLKREKAITSEHSTAIKAFLFSEQIHNWMRSKQASRAWIIFVPIKTPAMALQPDTPQPQINPRAQKLRCRDKILVIILGFCNSPQSYICIVLPMTKKTPQPLEKVALEFGLYWGISTCHWLRAYLHLKWAVNVFDTLWERVDPPSHVLPR